MEITLNQDRLAAGITGMVKKFFEAVKESPFLINTMGCRLYLESLVETTVLIIGKHYAPIARERVIKGLPDDFHPCVLPFSWWLGKDEEFELPMTDIPTVKDLLLSLPKSRRVNRTELITRYFYLLSSLNSYFTGARDQGKKVKVYFTAFSGDPEGQMMANFSVKDLGKEVKDSYNWHGQNTSQWIFAGCLLSSEDGSFSIHT
jgi:hypothetical protein